MRYLVRNRKISGRLLGPFMAIALVAVTMLSVAFFANRPVSAGTNQPLSASWLASYCSGNPTHYYEGVYFANSSGTYLGVSPELTIPAGSDRVYITYKMETWFCQKRTQWLRWDAGSFAVKENGVGPNLFTVQSRSPSDTSVTIDPNPGAIRHVSNILANGYITIPSSWKSGEVKNLCMEYSRPVSGYTGGHHEWGPPACSWVTIKYAPDWSTSGTSSVSQSTAAPGDTVSWTHRINKSGRTDTNASIWSQVVNSNAWSGVHSTLWIPSGRTNGVIRIIEGTSSVRRTITQDDVGKVFCQEVQWDPISSSGDRNGRVITPACVSVPYNYNLTPSIDSGSVPSRVTPSNTVSPTGSVSNDGPTKSKDDTIWQLTKFVVKSGGPVASAPVNDNLAPCGTSGPRAGNKYGAVNSSCWDIGSGGGAISPEASRSVVSGPTSVPGDLAVGDKLCFVLSARDRSHNPGSTRWRHSAPRCAVVAKSPKVDVLGGDLWTRGGVTTSTSQGSDASSKFGSSSEYATAANNLVNGLSSQLKFKKLPPVSQAAGMCTFSDLTLGNATSTTSGSTTSFNCADNAIGRYTILPAINRASTQLASSSGASALGAGNISIDDLNSLDSKAYTKASGNITIGRSDISAGKQVIISAANSDVYINDDITYTTDELNSISQIPQVVIIARNIYISQNTSQVDSWLVAAPTGTTNGYLNTCYLGVYANRNDLVSGLHAEVCDRPLTVNGPVTAKKLLLRRTAGSNNYGRDEQLISGETFNLRPDAYLWLYNRNSASAGIPTTLTKELPPRY